MFDLKRPCINCPFRKGQGELFRLPLPRLQEIFDGPAFQCHKTVDYDSGPCDESGFQLPVPGNKPNQCAGLMAVLAASGRPNQIMQVGERLRAFDPTKLDPDKEAYGSIEEVLEAHVQDSASIRGKGR